MKRRPRLIRLVTLAVVATLPVFGLSAVASAAKAKAGPSCVKHPHKATCRAGGGGGTGGTGGTPPNIIVSVSPDPVQETGPSEISAIVQVEALPIFANQTVDISSQQLLRRLRLGGMEQFRSHPHPQGPGTTGVPLDNDGNASMVVQGEDCAPGPNLIEADLSAAPYTTATATLTALPPAPTPAPTISGAPNPVVETGDGTNADPASQVYATFLIEENPVYAEQTVEVQIHTQLFSRCLEAAWNLGGRTFARVRPCSSLSTTTAMRWSISSVPPVRRNSLVTADLTVGTHDTFSTVFTIKPPAVTDI